MTTCYASIEPVKNLIKDNIFYLQVFTREKVLLLTIRLKILFIFFYTTSRVISNANLNKFQKKQNDKLVFVGKALC